ncbi:hypothetical protein Tco_0923387 [Tanacetum coccineum]|uniref:Uncharacterized protein n=1 Tax=Tanacetum coccineum TaxID=301880 RepID=A0ABQ5D468_9ASTR
MSSSDSGASNFVDKIKNINGKIIKDRKLRMTMCGVALNTLGTFVITLNGATRDQEVENPNTVDHITNIENENNNNDYVSVINKETNGEKQSFTAMFKKPTPLSVVVVVPFLDGFGYSFEMVDVEYEWQPPRCDSCKVFDHVDNDCPKRVKEALNQAVTEDDGFTKVIRRQGKDEGIDLVAVRNSFDVLREKDKVLDVVDTKSTPDPLDDDQDESHHELDEAQKDSDSDLTNIELREEEVAYLNVLHDALLIEERFLVQKAKVEWLKLEDANTAYFHKVVKSQASRNRIDSITNNNGVCVDEDQFNDLFCNRLSNDVANSMILEVSDKEIWDAMFSLGDNKAPGPDGYAATFFKEA